MDNTAGLVLMAMLTALVFMPNTKKNRPYLIALTVAIVVIGVVMAIVTWPF